jgi:hypothetical protein
MQADTYIPRRLDDQWKIGFWDVDVAAPILFGPVHRATCPARRSPSRCAAPASSLALDRAHQGRQAPGLRDALAVLAPAHQPADGDARHAAVAHPPHGRLSPRKEAPMDFERLNGDIKEMRRRNRGLGADRRPGRRPDLLAWW